MSLIFKRVFLALLLSSFFAFAACKSETDERNDEDEPVKIVGDSISPTGSDGLGREIDTVQRIERHLDSVNNIPQ